MHLSKKDVQPSSRHFWREAITLSLAVICSGTLDAQPEKEQRRYLEHVVLLAHPALEGRLPGEEGSALAEAVIARTFSQLGLSGAFQEGSFKQPFAFRQGGRFSNLDAAEIVEGFNVGGILPGKGALSSEWIVLGAHHDHIGRGSFGSRRGAGEIHEGADDNASGVAAVLLAAELLSERFADVDVTTPRRSILFITFSGEESGLNGSRHFVESPPFSLDRVAVMVNIDMVGRITEGAIALNGTGTGEGLEELVRASAESSPLEVRFPSGLTSRSDHANFYRRDIPVLFMTEALFPDEYHTPDDESWRINFEHGAAAARLAAEIVHRAALMESAPEFKAIEGFESGEGGPSLGDLKVRFGIKPGNYGDTEPGIAVAGVTPDTSAGTAGVLEGDRLLRWNGRVIEGVREWMLMMAEHEPGDIVTVTVLRQEKQLELPVMLQPRK